MNLNDIEKVIGRWSARIRRYYITDIVSAITSMESGSVTIEWQRPAPARHRQERVELRVVASRFLPEVMTLSIWE